ncbi:hypothetical protein CGRA01v4_02594 [Colletotrichum graminicola]|nr:hypothetical protein CGRA01v4_02594 [Colletotrichum graminicola]
MAGQLEHLEELENPRTTKQQQSTTHGQARHAPHVVSMTLPPSPPPPPPCPFLLTACFPPTPRHRASQRGANTRATQQKKAPL